MRRFCVLVALATGFVAVPALGAEPGTTVINSDYGSLTVMAILQGLFLGRVDASDIDRNGDGVVDDTDDAFNWDPPGNTSTGTQRNNHVDFQLQRARVILKGNLLTPNFTYLFQGDATVAEFALDAKLSFTIPEAEGYSTTISAGRFLPPFTLILPNAVTRLDMINYPLYLFDAQGACPAGFAANCRQPFATANTVGRQIGIVVNQKLFGMLSLDLGVFNGWQRTGAPNASAENVWKFTDENDWKDFLVRLQVKPIDGLRLALDFWAGFPMSVDSGVRDDPTTPGVNETKAPAPFFVAGSNSEYAHDEAYFGVFEAEFTMVENLKLEGEFVLSAQRTHTIDRNATPNVARDYESTGLGGWFHAGYLFPDLLGAGADLEAAARLDYYDPDIDVAGNGQLRLTFGPHFFLEGIHAQVRLNYLLNFLQSTRVVDRQAWDDQRHEFWLQVAFEI